MQIETRRGMRRVLTIEVGLATRRIYQARRKLNQQPSAAERAVLETWATRERLTFTPTRL